MVARFDPTTDVTLDELRVQLMYPFDAEADDFFRDRVRQAGEFSRRDVQKHGGGSDH